MIHTIAAKKMIAFLCVFMYLASPYRIFGHAMPEVIALLAIIGQFFISAKWRYLKGYAPFALYMLIIPPFVSLVTGLPGNYLVSFVPISLILYTILFCMVLPELDFYYVLKYYRILVLISVSFFLIQEVMFYSIGYRPMLYLPIEMYYQDFDSQSFSESRSVLERSSSFFLEPAHFAQYILPYFCILVYNVVKEKRLTKEFLIILFSLIILQSGSSYLGLLSIFISLLFFPNLLSKKLKVTAVAVFFILIVIAVIYLANNPFVMAILSRLGEISNMEAIASGPQSGFLRIWRGYFIYNALEPLYKLFGVGVGSIEYVSNLVYIPGSRYEGSFLNGIQTLLVTGGLIGLSLFFRFLYKINIKMCIEGKIILICMISMFFIEHMLFTPKMFLFILIAFAISKNGDRMHLMTQRI